MINKSYKIWIILFFIINLVLLVWSLGYFKFIEEKVAIQENTIIIEPDNKFKKSLPPKDESFPNEKSKLWGGFEDKKNKDQMLQRNTEAENIIEDNISSNSAFESQENRSIDNEKLDVKSPSKNQILEKTNSLDEKKLKNDLKINSEQIQNKSKNNKNLIEKKTDKTLVFYVQVASLSKKSSVEKEWYRFKKKHSKYMKDLIYISQKAELKNNRVFFRLLVGKFISKKEANNFCDKLNMSKCIVKKNNE